MSKATKAMAVAMTAAMAAGSLAGCGGVSMDKYASTVVATYGDEDIYLDEANFFLRSQHTPVTPVSGLIPVATARRPGATI